MFFPRLPGSADLKLIDGWLLIMIAVPFIEVILHTILNSMRVDSGKHTFEDRKLSEERLETISTLEKFAKFGVPIIFSGIIMAFIIVGLAIFFSV